MWLLVQQKLEWAKIWIHSSWRTSRGRYQTISEIVEEKGGPGAITAIKDSLGKNGSRLRAVILVLAFLVSMVFGFSLTNTSNYEIDEGPDAGFLHLLVHVKSKDLKLCQNLVSGAALNYPTPTLINWGVGTNSNLGEGGSSSAKISGMLEYLLGFGEERNDDLVLMVDGLDVWYQLRPGTMIERYWDINKHANYRIGGQLGKSRMERDNVTQRIIFSAQRRCWPLENHHPGCYAVPGSTVSPGIYGLMTDMVGKGENAYKYIRPRYLNSGVIMGDLGSMKKLFTRAQEMVQFGANFDSDQTVFARIFGEQELQREVMRERNIGYLQQVLRGTSGFLGMREPSILDKHKERHRMASTTNISTFEFGIGLDYESLLSHATVFAGSDSDWLQLDDAVSNLQVVEKHNVSSRIPPLLEDVVRSPPPFWSRNEVADGLPKTRWESTRLYTDLWSGKVPATMHHNVYSLRTNSPTSKGLPWDQMWFHNHSRALMDAYVNDPYRPFAKLVDEEAEKAWWDIHSKKWSLRTAKKDHEWIPWDDVCGDYWEQVLGDGKGAWKPPRTDFGDYA